MGLVVQTCNLSYWGGQVRTTIVRSWHGQFSEVSSQNRIGGGDGLWAGNLMLQLNGRTSKNHIKYKQKRM